MFRHKTATVWQGRNIHIELKWRERANCTAHKRRITSFIIRSPNRSFFTSLFQPCFLRFLNQFDFGRCNVCACVYARTACWLGRQMNSTTAIIAHLGRSDHTRVYGGARARMHARTHAHVRGTLCRLVVHLIPISHDLSKLHTSFAAMRASPKKKSARRKGGVDRSRKNKRKTKQKDAVGTPFVCGSFLLWLQTIKHLFDPYVFPVCPAEHENCNSRHCSPGVQGLCVCVCVWGGRLS